MLAAKHRKHVLCEKPLAESEEDGRKMAEAMKRADRILVLGFIYRFSDMGNKVRELVGNGAIGEPRSLRLVYIWDGHGKYIRTEKPGLVIPSEKSGSSRRVENLRRDRFMREGGPMIDCGVHQIDLARWWLSSDVARFTGHGTFIDDDYEFPDHIYIHMDHESGAHSMIESSFSYGHTAKDPQVHYRFEVIGTDGVVRFHRDTMSFELAQPSGTTKFEFQPEKNFEAMYAQFRNAIRTGDIGTFATAEDGIVATAITREATSQVKKRTPSPGTPGEGRGEGDFDSGDVLAL